jgi:hypothetical protein
VHSDGVELTLQKSWEGVPKHFVACAPHSSSIEHNDVQLISSGIVSSASAREHNTILVVHENGQELHSNLNMQHDLELWHRIREYDKGSTKVSFPLVLSKKHKQKIKQLQLWKPPYRTCSRGEASSTAQ